MTFRKLFNNLNPWNVLVWVGLLFFALSTTACASPADDLAQQLPARRGSPEDETLLQVQEITAETLDVPEAEVRAEADLRADLGADDEQMDRLAAELEEAFSVELSEAEIRAVTTVQSLVDLIESK